MSDTTAKPAWAVDSQAQRTKALENNQVVDGYDVYFHTAAGHTGSVFIPMNRYTPDNVKAAVADMAVQLDAVGNLTADS